MSFATVQIPITNKSPDKEVTLFLFERLREVFKWCLVPKRF